MRTMVRSIVSGVIMDMVTITIIAIMITMVTTITATVTATDMDTVTNTVMNIVTAITIITETFTPRSWLFRAIEPFNVSASIYHHLIFENGQTPTYRCACIAKNG